MPRPKTVIEDTQLLTSMWEDDSFNVDEVAAEFGCSRHTVSKIARELGLGRKATSYKGRAKMVDDSPDELLDGRWVTGDRGVLVWQSA